MKVVGIRGRRVCLKVGGELDFGMDHWSVREGGERLGTKQIFFTFFVPFEDKCCNKVRLDDKVKTMVNIKFSQFSC